ncbi:MAG TPA: sugar ABC transporter substrate-binding protein [Trebonia sp.]|nr:sugar ABC transporter substrate-binding protein [Trebonia sp.]
MPHLPATRSLRRGAAAAAFAAAALGLAACSGSSSAPAAATSSAAASSPAASAAAATSSKQATIAYLSFAVDNSYDAPMLAAAQAVASADGATLKVFDANNSPQTQFDQMQTVINSGQYNGIITQPIESTGLVSLVKEAIAKGIKVVNMDQILGSSLSTAAPQVAGLSANVTFVPTTIGTQLGQQVIAACASKSLSPCKVGYLYDIKASSLDTAIYGAFTAAIKGSPVQVVTFGQSFFTPTIGLTAVETMLQGNHGLNLIVGSDQGIEGAMTALSTTDKADHVLLVGYGASAAAVAGIQSGAVFSDVAQAPSAEGTDAVKALVAAIQSGKVSGAVDPVAGFPDSGVVNKADVSQFTPEWQG